MNQEKTIHLYLSVRLDDEFINSIIEIPEVIYNNLKEQGENISKSLDDYEDILGNLGGMTKEDLVMVTCPTLLHSIGEYEQVDFDFSIINLTFLKEQYPDNYVIYYDDVLNRLRCCSFIMKEVTKPEPVEFFNPLMRNFVKPNKETKEVIDEFTEIIKKAEIEFKILNNKTNKNG